MDNTNRTQQWILTEEGLLKLSTEILEIVNQRIESSIVTEINEESDDKHVPSARAVYEIINAFPHMKTQFVTSDIEDIPLEERSDKIIYVQTSVDSEYCAIYFWKAEDEAWVCVKADLSNYWTKDDEDITDLKERLGVNDVEGRVADLETGVDNIGAISDGDLDRIIEQAINDSLENLYDDDPVEPGEEEQDPNNSDPDNPDEPGGDPDDSEIMG